MLAGSDDWFTLREDVGLLVIVVAADIVRVDEVVSIVAIRLQFHTRGLAWNNVSVARSLDVLLLPGNRNHSSLITDARASLLGSVRIFRLWIGHFTEFLLDFIAWPRQELGGRHWLGEMADCAFHLALENAVLASVVLTHRRLCLVFVRLIIEWTRGCFIR